MFYETGYINLAYFEAFKFRKRRSEVNDVFLFENRYERQPFLFEITIVKLDMIDCCS